MALYALAAPLPAPRRRASDQTDTSKRAPGNRRGLPRGVFQKQVPPGSGRGRRGGARRETGTHARTVRCRGVHDEYPGHGAARRGAAPGGDGSRSDCSHRSRDEPPVLPGSGPERLGSRPRQAAPVPSDRPLPDTTVRAHTEPEREGQGHVEPSPAARRLRQRARACRQLVSGSTRCARSRCARRQSQRMPRRRHFARYRCSCHCGPCGGSRIRDG